MINDIIINIFKICLACTSNAWIWAITNVWVDKVMRRKWSHFRTFVLKQKSPSQTYNGSTKTVINGCSYTCASTKMVNETTNETYS